MRVKHHSFCVCDYLDFNLNLFPITKKQKCKIIHRLRMFYYVSPVECFIIYYLLQLKNM